MRETQYWVRICEGERCLGAGFLITRAFVLTALHCLRWRSAGNSRFDLELPDGRRLAGQLCEEIKDADLALIAVEDAESHGLAPAAPTDWPRPEVGWRGTYCPPSEETRLSGRVTHETVDYRNAADGVYKAVQLTVDQQLGTYDGYSGSPVDTAGAEARHEQHGQTAPRPVVGILMEERLDRADASRVSNVLIAASVLHAMDRFTQFSIGHLRNQVSVPESHRPAPPAAQAQQGDEEHTTPSLTSTDLYLRQLRRWEEEGVLSQEEATEERRWALRLLRRRLAQGPVDG